MTEDVGTTLIELLSSFYWILLKTKLKWIVKLDNDVHFMYDQIYSRKPQNLTRFAAKCVVVSKHLFLWNPFVNKNAIPRANSK